MEVKIDMKAFWNQRYDEPEYAYGTQPNLFFKDQLDQLTPGKLLMPAEGEGRNAVYAAGKGWEVTAFDSSSSGQKKALQLAQEKKVTLNYVVADALEIVFPEASFDAVGLIFVHLPPDLRSIFHQKVVSWLKPGGTLILEGFSTDQLHHPSGGPREPAMLFSTAILREDFGTLQSLHIEEMITTLDEGRYHVGSAAVIRAVGTR